MTKRLWRLKDEMILIAILTMAILLRLIALDKVPNGFFPDEASNAYDAYSILHTGRDQYGNFLPLVFKSANDYREGLYIYFSVIFIKILGLNEFAARMPSAMIGTLTVLIIYYLCKEFCNSRVALFSALFLAISPWHIQFSRIAFRAILLPCLLSLGLLCFFKSLKQPKYLPLSGFIFATSIFTYQSARVFVPLFLLGLSVTYYKFLKKNILYTVGTAIVFLIIFIPQLIFYLSPQGMTRANDVIFNTNFFTIIKCYFHHFSPDFLFFQGDPNPRHLPQNRGEVYYFEMLSLPLGLFCLLKQRSKEKTILILWLILFPLPAALTTEVHSIRGIMGVTILAIISGYGMSKLLDILNTYIKNIATPFIIFTVVISVLFFSHRYFVEYPRWLPEAWLSTMGDIITYANDTDAQCIVIDTNIYGEHIYILVPFYTQLSPSEYHKLGVDVANDKLDMGRWKVRNLNQLNPLNEQCLYITSSQQVVNLTNRGYNPQSIHYFWDINGKQLYQLLTIKLSSG